MRSPLLLPITLSLALVAGIAGAALLRPPATSEPAPAAPELTRPAASQDHPSDLDSVEQWLASGNFTISHVLADPKWMPLHMDATFRALMKQYGTAPDVVMVTPEEPGTPLVVKGTVNDLHGQPIAGALVYAYHTDQTGVYGNEGSGHDPTQHNRLFGYCTTGEAGEFRLQTIRPGSYPNRPDPQHIHFELTPPGGRLQWAGILFDDDPRLTSEDREENPTNCVLKPTTDEHGTQSGHAEFRIER